MVVAIELLRNLAGIMFWAFADFFLGACWIAVILGLCVAVFRGSKRDD